MKTITISTSNVDGSDARSVSMRYDESAPFVEVADVLVRRFRAINGITTEQERETDRLLAAHGFTPSPREVA